jgi:hypothetical protein
MPPDTALLYGDKLIRNARYSCWVREALRRKNRFETVEQARNASAIANAMQ